MAKRRLITIEDVPGLLAALGEGDADAKQRVLQQLCPCRSKCDHGDLWMAICHAYDSHDVDRKVRDQAFHALQTLLEVAETRQEARDMVDWLVEQRALWLPLENPNRPKRRPPAREPKPNRKLTYRDVPALLESLSCEDQQEQHDTLTLLCPCRNRLYDQGVWVAIFEAHERGETGAVRDQAGHAIGTLLERARTDPRSQDLLQRLTDLGIECPSVDNAIPTWRPNLRGNGLYIPRFEQTTRSKSNRRR